MTLTCRSLKGPLRVGVKYLMALLIFSAVTLLIAWLAMQFPQYFARVAGAIREHTVFWQLIRLGLYYLSGVLAFRIWHAPGFKPEYRPPFIRIMTASMAFVLLCEFVLFRGQSL